MSSPRPFPGRWVLDPSVRFLNHGSFGACPRAVLLRQGELRARMEAEPVRFMVRELPALLDDVGRALGGFLGADPQDLALVPNASTGVSTVLRSLDLQPGDELLTCDHAYPACKNALEAVAARAGARVTVARVPFPVRGPDEVLGAFLAAVTGRTRLALVDHVTSPTGLVFPVADLVAALQQRGVDVLVDGAHAPGMVPLDLRALGAAYYTGNCHKWLCAPKGAGFLHVRRDRQAGVRPLVISHGATAPLRGRSRFQREFEWTGTQDPTAWLCIPSALRALAELVPGGWDEVRRRNHDLAVEARGILCRALQVEPPCPEAMLGSLAAVPLPDDPTGAAATMPLPLQDALLDRHGIQVPVFPWPAPPRRLVRVSAQLYNAPEDYAALATALGEELGRERAR